jgi:hypothetical protein
VERPWVNRFSPKIRKAILLTKLNGHHRRQHQQVLGTVMFLLGFTWGDKYLDPKNRLLRRHLDVAVDAIVENAGNNNSSERPKSLLQLLSQAEENYAGATSSRTSSVCSS